jgi:hypothetical protein
LVRRERIAARRGEEVLYFLARSGAMALPATNRRELIRHKPAYGEIAHLLRTGDILDRLEARYGIVRWRGERFLKSASGRQAQGAQVADFSVELRRPIEGTTAWLVEVDGAYYGAHLEQKITSLARCGEWVLWVTYASRRLDHLRGKASAFPRIRPTLFEAL